MFLNLQRRPYLALNFRQEGELHLPLAAPSLGPVTAPVEHTMRKQSVM